MPYKNIHWVKLEKRLLNDYRFFTMSEDAQLVFVKLLMFAAASDNKMTRKSEVLKEVLRYKGTPSELQVSINEIRANFPKFKANRFYYYFKEFDNRLNWVAGDTEKELLRNSSDTPKEGTDKNKIKNKIKIRKESHISPSDMKLAQLLYDLIKKNTPNWYHKPNLNDWADEIRKLREIDKQPIEVIEKVIKWCQDDDFWYKNILSTAKLRKQFPKLLVQMNEKKKVPFDYAAKKAKETEEYFKKLNKKL